MSIRDDVPTRSPGRAARHFTMSTAGAPLCKRPLRPPSLSFGVVLISLRSLHLQLIGRARDDAAHPSLRRSRHVKRWRAIRYWPPQPALLAITVMVALPDRAKEFYIHLALTGW